MGRTAHGLLMLTFAAALAGCGGGSSGSTPPIAAAPTAATCGAAAGATNSQSIVFATGTTLTLPTVGYCSISLSLPANNTATGSAIFDVTTSVSAPSGVATPPPGTGSNGVPSGQTPLVVLWITVSPESGVTLTSPTSPTLNVTFYGTGTCSSFYAWTVPAGKSGAYSSGAFAPATATFGGQTNSPSVVQSAAVSTAIACL